MIILTLLLNLILSLGIDFLIALAIKYGVYLSNGVDLNILGVFIVVAAISSLVNISWGNK